MKMCVDVTEKNYSHTKMPDLYIRAVMVHPPCSVLAVLHIWRRSYAMQRWNIADCLQAFIS